MRTILTGLLALFASGLSAQDSGVRFEGQNCNMERDLSLPGKPIVKIAFGCHSDATDGDLEKLKQFPELRKFSVLSDHISDAGLEHLKSLPKLEVLNLNSEKITDKGLEQVVAIPKLRSLVLFRSKVTADGLALLKKAAELRALYLIRIPITSEGVAQLKELSQLETLGFQQLQPEWREKAAELRALLPRTKVSIDR